MSLRARRTAFAALVALLVAAAALLIARQPSQPPPPIPETPRRIAAETSFRELEERVRERVESFDDGRIHRRGVAEHEDEPPLPAAWERTRRAAEPLARRFFGAYSLYEIGRGAAGVSRVIAETASRDFAEELLAAPPRLLVGGKAPPRAELAEGEMTLLPGPQDYGQGELSSIELVGEVRRGGEASPLAFTMELFEGRWEVTGMGL